MEEGRKYRRTCCVPQCANRTLRRKICLPSFPSDAAMRRGWMLRLCVDDFKCPQASTAERKLLRLKKTAVPSQCLPVTKDAEHAQLALTNICDMSTVLHESDGTHGRHEKVGSLSQMAQESSEPTRGGPAVTPPAPVVEAASAAPSPSKALQTPVPQGPKICRTPRPETRVLAPDSRSSNASERGMDVDPKTPVSSTLKDKRSLERGKRDKVPITTLN
ncbi:uncharacterized protein [Dermacentor andersoni]|uniref:uncharacterized protein isoform X1 n=1 Tax=Dermacentor andersoni TaxID=34620 RepID=UPI003B3A8AB7